MSPGLALALGILSLGFTPFSGHTGEPAKAIPVTIRGRVTCLVDLLKTRAIEADPGPIERQVILVTDSNEIIPILLDPASRALFEDKRLRDRDVEIDGRRISGFPYLQIVNTRVHEQGEWRAPEYACETCRIVVRYPQICPCCQADLELRFAPARP